MHTQVGNGRQLLRPSSNPVQSRSTQRLRIQGHQRQCVQHWLLQQQHQPSHVCHALKRPLEVSSSIAAARVAESSRPDALFQDPFAACLSAISQPSNAGTSPSSNNQEAVLTNDAIMDVIATRYIDESLLNAMDATNVNTIQSGDYRQVVLLGDGMDTRPFRLMWPPGTLLFLVAPAEVHEKAEALLAAAPQPAHVMRGCLLRRVNMNLQHATEAGSSNGSTATTTTTSSSNISSSSGSASGSGKQGSSSSSIFAEQLMRAGFRGDRLSVWALQGLHDQGLATEVMQQLLAEVADCAAFHSLLVGELPGHTTQRAAENLMAEAGLLGAVYDYGTADGGQYKRWQEVALAGSPAAPAGAAAAPVGAAAAPGATATPSRDRGSTVEEVVATTGSSGTSSSSSIESGSGSSSCCCGDRQEGEVVSSRWLCTAQQLRLSLAQMGIYDDWSTEFEEADYGDDYMSNIS